MELLILAAIWAVVLVPPWIRSRGEVRPAQSIVSFHRKLSSLERTTPRYEAYSDEMYLDTSYLDEWDEGVADEDGYEDEAAVLDLRTPVTSTAARSAPVAAPQAASVGPGSSVASVAPGAPVAPGARLASRAALRRRRHIFFGLLGVAVLTMAAGVLLDSVVAWMVHGGTLVLFGTYVVLLVSHQQRMAEQALKVRHLAPLRPARPAVVVLRSGSAVR